MQIHFFNIPIHDAGEASAKLNQLLASHRIVDVQRQFVSAGSQSSWQICVTVTSASQARVQKSRIDYREVLSESDFKIFAALRTLRKTMAEKERLPAYALFTNEQLAEIVTQKASSLQDLKRIEGIGPTRVEKYGPAFLSELRKISLQDDPGSDVDEIALDSDETDSD